MKKAELEHVLVQLPIAVCIIDEARTIVFANAAFSGGLTLRQADLTGRLLDDVFPEQIRFLKRKINSVFALKNPSFSYWQQRPHVFPMSSSRPITGDETEMYQNVQFIPLLDSAGEVAHLCMVVSDVTAEASYFLQQSELKAALEEEHQQLQTLHAELKQAQQQMLQSEKMASIGQLAAGVAHEINNPVGFVRSNLETMQDYTSKLINVMERQQKIIQKQAEPRFIAVLNDLYERLGVSFIQSDLPDLIEESLAGTERVRSIVKSLRDFATY
ncbi:MAG: PAS domain-containing protein, partial [Alkalimonas sp.]|nr:PAS domain-containing protein [Alkalimonas sp.]